MNSILQKSNEEAIFNVYLYLAHKITPIKYETFSSIISRTESILKKLSPREIYRLNLLKNYLKTNKNIANSKLIDFTYSKDGLTACVFIKPNGSISVIFKGTGGGEWIDNGEGLSGIPQENTYLTYKNNKNIIFSQTIYKDFATEQQVEALNWFYGILAQNHLNNTAEIIVSGHSKGGNKAQFVAMHVDFIKYCFSFDGQGFSPEAVLAFKKLYSNTYEKRRSRIYSLSAANDYVNVLGERITPENNIYFFESKGGLHNIEAILDNSGFLRPQINQGKLSKYAQNLSDRIMTMNPEIRQHATLGIMNIFQKYVGRGTPVNGDFVSSEKTIAGIGIAATAFLNQLIKNT